MSKKQPKGVDTKCWELAEDFMCEVPMSTQNDVRELAEAIQTACEDACQQVEERIRKENEQRE